MLKHRFIEIDKSVLEIAKTYLESIAVKFEESDKGTWVYYPDKDISLMYSSGYSSLNIMFIDVPSETTVILIAKGE